MSDMQLTAPQLLAWLTQARLAGAGDFAATRVQTDTRAIAAGDLFVALRGARFDGHDFLVAARAAGAVAALCEPGHVQAMGWQGVEVPDTRVALGQLAAGWRRQFALPLIAVTGSNGKTTVTQMLAAIARVAVGDAALATQGNLNNDIGVPLTLLRLRDSHRLAVVELGMNHPGEIAALAQMAAPTVALVNNAQREHQEYMGSVDAVAQENGQSLLHLPADGVAVFPADSTYSGLWRDGAGMRRCVCFAMTAMPSAQVYPTQLRWADTHWQLEVHTPAGDVACQLHAAGRHNVHNALAAIAAAVAADVAPVHIAQGLSHFRPVKGRSRIGQVVHHGRTITLVDDTYNANPDSVLAAIDLLADLPAPHVLVLGDMGEVGSAGAAFHAEVGDYARQRGIAHVLTLGGLAQHSAQAHGGGQHCGDSPDDMPALLQALPDVLAGAGSVLVKGSRFMRMERVPEALHCCFDE